MEKLGILTVADSGAWTRHELLCEGFPKISAHDFVKMFCKSHKGVTAHSIINRIEFKYVD